MVSITAGYFDGITATRHKVQLRLAKDWLLISGENLALSYPVSTLKVSDGIGSIIRTVRLPNDGICELTDAAFIAALEKVCHRSTKGQWVHRWEKSQTLVLASLLLLGVAPYSSATWYHP